MSTPWEPDNQKFSDQAHLAAQRLLYPDLFGVTPGQLEFVGFSGYENPTDRLLDTQMAIDRDVKVHLSGLIEYPLSFTIQERFRRPRYANWRDITITQWNHNSNLPSELHKLNAGIFLYGYYNPSKKAFIEAIAIDCVALLIAIIHQRLIPETGRNPRTNQTFWTFGFDQLIRESVVLCHWAGGATLQLPLSLDMA